MVCLGGYQLGRGVGVRVVRTPVGQATGEEMQVPAFYNTQDHAQS